MPEKTPRSPEQLDRTYKYIVERWNRGEKRAFGLIFNHLNPQLVGYARNRGLDYGHFSSHDFASEAWVKVISVLNQYKPKPYIPFKSWFWKVATNQLTDSLRGAQRRLASELPCDLPSRRPPIENAVIHKVDVRGAMRLDGLTKEETAIIVGRYLYGYTQAELAELLGIPSGTVKSRFSRGQEKLKAALETYSRSL